MAEVWGKVLGIEDPISATADFFDMGGNSLLAGALAAALREQFQISLSVAAVFNAKTVCIACLLLVLWKPKLNSA